MRKLPRDLDAQDLVRALERRGYLVVRQRGSHVSLRKAGAQPITVPRHSPLKVGTLNAILATVARQEGLTVQQLLLALFD